MHAIWCDFGSFYNFSLKIRYYGVIISYNFVLIFDTKFNQFAKCASNLARLWSLPIAQRKAMTFDPPPSKAQADRVCSARPLHGLLMWPRYRGQCLPSWLVRYRDHQSRDERNSCWLKLGWRKRDGKGRPPVGRDVTVRLINHAAVCIRRLVLRAKATVYLHHLAGVSPVQAVWCSLHQTVCAEGEGHCVLPPAHWRLTRSRGRPAGTIQHVHTYTGHINYNLLYYGLMNKN